MLLMVTCFRIILNLVLFTFLCLPLLLTVMTVRRLFIALNLLLFLRLFMVVRFWRRLVLILRWVMELESLLLNRPKRW